MMKTITSDNTTSSSTENGISGSAVVPKWNIIYWLKKFWSNISIEPIMVCWLVPTCLLYIASENLSLEKVFYFLISALLFKLCDFSF